MFFGRKEELAKLLLFAYGHVAELKASTDWKQYLATLASSLSETDPELCEKFCQSPGSLLTVEAMKALLPTLGIERATSTLTQIIRDAQRRFCLPEIEKRRLDIVEEYHVDLEKILPQSDRYGTILQKPADMELSSLIHNLKIAKICFPEGVLQNMEALRTMRNKLSHMAILGIDDLYTLLGNLSV